VRVLSCEASIKQSEKIQIHKTDLPYTILKYTDFAVLPKDEDENSDILI
jgi:hypothetical protein